MKMILIAYNEAIDEEVFEVLEASGERGYTKWTRVLGDGRSSGPHLATPVWPKANNVLMLCAEEEQVAKILAGIRLLRTKMGREGVKAFTWNVEEAT
jgi:nitrogen regulatory protein PII